MPSLTMLCTINKPCGEPGSTSSSIDKYLCETHYLNLLPQSCQIFTCHCTSWVAGPRSITFSPRSGVSRTSACTASPLHGFFKVYLYLIIYFKFKNVVIIPGFFLFVWFLLTNPSAYPWEAKTH